MHVLKAIVNKNVFSLDLKVATVSQFLTLKSTLFQIFGAQTMKHRPDIDEPF